MFTFVIPQAIAQMQQEYVEEKDTNDSEGFPDLETLSIESMTLDNASFASVMEFAQEFKTSGRKLNTLICNAGTMTKKYGKKKLTTNLVAVCSPKRILHCDSYNFYSFLVLNTMVQIMAFSPRFVHIHVYVIMYNFKYGCGRVLKCVKTCECVDISEDFIVVEG